jgi:hypothetical protein
MSDTTSLDRITVNLVPQAQEALSRVMSLTGYSKTDAVNRSVQLYSFVEGVLKSGDQVLIRKPDGTTELVHLI